jgi:signal transduction histidine kinase
MLRRRLSRYAPFLITGVLVALLCVLAVLEHRWIFQLSQMQHHRLQAGLLASGLRFTEDFDREVTRAWLYFSPDSTSVGDTRERAVRRLDRWITEAPRPRLIREVFYVRGNLEGGLDAEVLRPGARRFEPVPWPAELDSLRRRTAHSSGLMPVLPDGPALVVPVLPPRRLAGERRHSFEHLIVRLDSGEITGELLPDLTRRHFGEPGEREYSLAVVTADGSGRVIFQSDPDLSAAALRSGGDQNLPMLGLRRFDELRGLWFISAPHQEKAEEKGGHHRVIRHRVLSPLPGGREETGAWRLVLMHRDGTLEQAVSRFKHKNLAVSTGILLLLGVTAGMMAVTAQRAQKLARRQMELVAGVTHELHTPITAIRSAGQNLADGVVADSGQVKRYGTLIEREGQRLSQMVGLMLELAGLQSGRAPSLQPTTVEEVLDGALEDCRWLLEERQARVEKDIGPGLPAVMGDAGALRRALRNLVENAAKYGGRSPWIGVRARVAGKEVEVTVEDRGPGIRREDLPHLFEPFYRGREVKSGGVPGSGLGLSVVQRIAEAHRGRVSVAAGGPGQGSAFTLHLPIAPEGAA